MAGFDTPSLAWKIKNLLLNHRPPLLMKHPSQQLSGPSTMWRIMSVAVFAMSPPSGSRACLIASWVIWSGSTRRR